MNNTSRINGKFHHSVRILARENAPETYSSEPTLVEQAKQEAARNGMRLWY
ncbi:hypothetical protein [Paenibacillus sp. FSL H7-0714]|uniref:hypothetical protein n=1 Tax=Paenibacillus sp. FSL H7-0714 TaxID=2954735 RepID=UPI0030F647A9